MTVLNKTLFQAHYQATLVQNPAASQMARGAVSCRSFPYLTPPFWIPRKPLILVSKKKYHRRWRQHRAITAYTVDTVDTVDTDDTVYTVYTVYTFYSNNTLNTVYTVECY